MPLGAWAWRCVSWVAPQAATWSVSSVQPTKKQRHCALGHTPVSYTHLDVYKRQVLELWCVSRDGQRRWKLEYNIRERSEAGDPDSTDEADGELAEEDLEIEIAGEV